MSEEKVYPAIYADSDSAKYLYLDSGKYYCYSRRVWDSSSDEDDHPNDTNITHEYLANTCGEVVSPEHAEFIIELAENAGYSLIKSYEIGDFFFITKTKFGFSSKGFCSLDAKQIAIPLPPKQIQTATPEEEFEMTQIEKNNGDNLIFGCAGKCGEWPCVGSIVTWGNKSVKGEVKALSDGLAWIKNEYGNHCTEYVSSLVKPKTPEEELSNELESEIKSMVAFTNYNPRKIAKWIISGEIEGLSYNITKKPQ